MIESGRFQSSIFARFRFLLCAFVASIDSVTVAITLRVMDLLQTRKNNSEFKLVSNTITRSVMSTMVDGLLVLKRRLRKFIEFAGMLSLEVAPMFVVPQFQVIAYAKQNHVMTQARESNQAVGD